MMLLGAIVGGSSIEERKRCAKEVSLRNVSGLHNLCLIRHFNNAFKCDFHLDVLKFETWQAGFNVLMSSMMMMKPMQHSLSVHTFDVAFF